MPIKFIATDIDGTIMQHDFSINPEVKNCISKLSADGVKVVLVTGRMHCATDFIADELGLKTPIVSYQGGLIRDFDKTILYERNLQPEIASEIIKWADENAIHLNLYLNDELFVQRDDEIINRYATERRTPYQVSDFSSLELSRINKMLAIDFEDAQKVSEWENHLKQAYPDIHIVKSTPYFCEICHGEAMKSNAVEFLRKSYGLLKEEILTIGDQNNDVELLSAGGIKVAMGNATPELKAVADYVTDTVEENGFVKAIERFVYGASCI